MRQPHLLYFGFLGKCRRLIERHMLVFYCFCRFFLFSVHSFTNKQIRTGRIFFDRVRRPGVCRVRQFYPFSRRAKHKIRGIDFILCLNRLAILKPAPIRKRNSLFFCPLSIEFSGAVNFHRISVTKYVMIYTESFQSVSVYLECLFSAFYLLKNDRKRKLGRNHSKAAHHPLKSFWSDQCKRLCTVCISHRKEQSRKTAYMISVIMCKTNHINRFKTPSFFFNRNLRSFSAVYKHTTSIKPRHKRRQITIRKRHHPAASQQTYI